MSIRSDGIHKLNCNNARHMAALIRIARTIGNALHRDHNIPMRVEEQEEEEEDGAPAIGQDDNAAAGL